MVMVLVMEYWQQYLESRIFINGIQTKFEVSIVSKAKDFIFSVLVGKVGCV